MNNKTIVLTGITGFIGSHVAEILAANDYKVIGVVRTNSNFERLQELQRDNIQLVNLDKHLREKLTDLNASVFIHSAWGGVSVSERNDWSLQAGNIKFTAELFSLCHEIGIKKFICFGSQAEYGEFSGRVNETYRCKPVTAYGANKLATLKIVEAFADTHSINWYWLRLFSVYGIREDDNWFIPSVIRNALQNKDMCLTGCEQRYDYVNARDLANAVLKVIQLNAPSGVFNLSSNSSASLRSIIDKVKVITQTKAQFKFGELPYRPNQVMHMEGDSSKFFETFQVVLQSNFDLYLNYLVDYYRKRLTSLS